MKHEPSPYPASTPGFLVVLRPEHTPNFFQEGVRPDISTANERGPVSNSNFRWPDNSNIRTLSSLGPWTIAGGGSSRRWRPRKKNQMQAVRLRVRGNPRPMPTPSKMFRDLRSGLRGIAVGDNETRMASWVTSGRRNISLPSQHQVELDWQHQRRFPHDDSAWEPSTTEGESFYMIPISYESALELIELSYGWTLLSHTAELQYWRSMKMTHHTSAENRALRRIPWSIRATGTIGLAYSFVIGIMFQHADSIW